MGRWYLWATGSVVIGSRTPPLMSKSADAHIPTYIYGHRAMYTVGPLYPQISNHGLKYFFWLVVGLIVNVNL